MRPAIFALAVFLRWRRQSRHSPAHPDKTPQPSPCLPLPTLQKHPAPVPIAQLHQVPADRSRVEHVSPILPSLGDSIMIISIGAVARAGTGAAPQITSSICRDTSLLK